MSDVVDSGHGQDYRPLPTTWRPMIERCDHKGAADRCRSCHGHGIDSPVPCQATFARSADDGCDAADSTT